MCLKMGKKGFKGAKIGLGRSRLDHLFCTDLGQNGWSSPDNLPSGRPDCTWNVLSEMARKSLSPKI